MNTVNIAAKEIHSDTIIMQWFKRLLPAQILSSVTAALGSIVNGLLVGNFLPDEAMVALGFVVPMTAMLGAIAAVISGGARILCGQYMGRGELDKLNDVFTAVILFSVTVGGVLTAAGLLLSEPLAALFGATGDATAPTAEYIRGLAIGIIPTLLVPGLMVLLQMVNQIGYAFASSIVLAVVILGGGLLNVTVFDGGVFGMGAANSVAQFVTMLFLLFRFVQKKKLMHPGKVKGNGDLYKKIVVLGSPIAFANLLYALRNVVINSMVMRWGGADAVSSLAILNSCMGPFDAVNIGIASTALILASIFAGEKDNMSMELLMKVTIKIGLICGFGKLILLSLGGKGLAILFGAREALADETHLLIVLYSLSTPLNILVMSVLSVHQALGRVKLSNTVYFFNAFFFPLAWLFIAGSLISLRIAWLLYFMAEVLTLALLFFAAMRKKNHFPSRLSDWIWMEESKNAKKISLSLYSMEDVMAVSAQLVDFCRQNGIDSRRSNLCGLSAEEMAGNVVTHGFAKSKRTDLVLDLFVLIEGDNVILRIRDNAPVFEPQLKLGAFDPENPCKNIGIRMVAGMAKEMTYQTCFGLNVLNIVL